jgi:hypothetical protein
MHSPEPESVLPEITLAQQQRLECLGGYINGSTVYMTIGTDAQRFTGA